jgi:hydrogenase small subunit
VSYLVNTIDEICSDQRTLDVLCIEGSIITAPNKTGMYDTLRGEAKMAVVERLANKARFVVAMGTCAAFGGVHASGCNPSDCIGLQYEKAEPGGLLAPDWRSKGGLPVINVAGCPAHPNTMTQTLAILASGSELELDHLNRPKAFFNTMVHQGCTRNEYHEYNVEAEQAGDNACLFFHMGCQGPTTEAICNHDLWNNRSSKTRAGVPCFGCTSPDFPRETELYLTEKIGPIPTKLPTGVERGAYMAYKNLAANAAPKRVKDKKMDT